MGDVTKIEWADHTFNPWEGCQKVSPACDNCYAEARNARFNGSAINWGPGAPRRRTSAANWRKPFKWNADAIAAGTRPFVFCASLADVFDKAVDPVWRADLFDVTRATPQLVWLFLTKRIGNAVEMAEAAGGLPGNVALGATMANQDEYDRDAFKLAQARRRLDPLFTFGSFEPLLGPIRLDHQRPDWIIVGGESGRNARAMDLQWARDLQFQAERLGCVFNFKQVGGRGSDKGGHELDGMTYFARPTVTQRAEPQP
jgi:protein gp37